MDTVFSSDIVLVAWIKEEIHLFAKVHTFFQENQRILRNNSAVLVVVSHQRQRHAAGGV